jgi:hypothetical protein
VEVPFFACQGYWQAVEVHLIGRLRIQAGVLPGNVVEVDVTADGLPGLVDRGVGVQGDLFVLETRSTKIRRGESRQRPLPSMLILIPSFFSRPVKVSLVNWLPWSVLKISGLSFLERASSSASMQKEASMVIDSFQASTRRLYQSTTAAKATFALNAAVWFLRGRLLIRSLLHSHLRLPKNRTST